MRFIYPSVEFVEEEDPLKKIELCGRLCYKSEPAGNPVGFVKRLIERGHMAMLEHCHFVFQLFSTASMLLKESCYGYPGVWQKSNLWGISRFVNITSSLKCAGDGPENLYISGSPRAFREWFENTGNVVAAFCLLKIYVSYPVFVEDLISDVKAIAEKYLLANDGIPPQILLYKNQDAFFKSFTGKTISEFKKLATVEEFRSTFNLLAPHIYQSIKFTTNRGVSHEIVRHRICSIAQESTRYVNYAKASELTFIIPPWAEFISDHPDDFSLEDFTPELLECFQESPEYYWYQNCLNCENDYLETVRRGYKPEQSRDALNHSVKTEIIMTADLKEWHHFLDLRSRGLTGTPHPEMKVVADQALNLFNGKYGDDVV